MMFTGHILRDGHVGTTSTFAGPSSLLVERQRTYLYRIASSGAATTDLVLPDPQSTAARLWERVSVAYLGWTTRAARLAVARALTRAPRVPRWLRVTLASTFDRVLAPLAALPVLADAADRTAQRLGGDTVLGPLAWRYRELCTDDATRRRRAAAIGWWFGGAPEPQWLARATTTGNLRWLGDPCPETPLALYPVPRLGHALPDTLPFPHRSESSVVPPSPTIPARASAS